MLVKWRVDGVRSPGPVSLSRRGGVLPKRTAMVDRDIPGRAVALPGTSDGGGTAQGVKVSRSCSLLTVPRNTPLYAANSAQAECDETALRLTRTTDRSTKLDREEMTGESTGSHALPADRTRMPATVPSRAMRSDGRGRLRRVGPKAPVGHNRTRSIVVRRGRRPSSRRRSIGLVPTPQAFREKPFA